MTTLSEPLVTPKYDKWRQLVLGLICMAAISSPQYVWTLLTKPLAARLGVGLPELQVTFSLLIILQTFFSPFQGRLVEKFGPRRLIAIGTVMAGMSWVLSAQVKGLATLWLVYGCMGGLGTGIVYIGVVGLMVKWFPRQRGFAAGAVAAGYGMGAIITTFPISLSLTTNGLEHTLTTFGILFALVGFLASQGLKLPPPAVSLPVSQTVAQSSRSLTIDRFTNGLTRPLFGFISDRFGREQTMFIAFALEGVAMTLWLACREDPLLFVLLSGVVFFGWGEIFSLFPSTLTDTFGSENAASNYGWLYISQGIGSIFGGPLAALLYQYTHGWHVVFSCAIGLDFITAALALWVLKPWRARFIRQHS
ncbi:TPA: MFS transporter [Klebsiella quasipneumoniae subsp. similipneumoniae]|nr:MFS transporter [Klebsiella quasipneumoniae subsp. similipneumoniae]